MNGDERPLIHRQEDKEAKFSQQWVYTPKKEDNGLIIKCKVEEGGNKDDLYMGVRYPTVEWSRELEVHGMFFRHFSFNSQGFFEATVSKL